jgi:hypothetical protein
MEASCRIFTQADLLPPATNAIIGVSLFTHPSGRLISMPAEAQKKDANAIRADCFRQANEAVAALGFSPNPAAKNSAGYNAYRACAQRNGIRP